MDLLKRSMIVTLADIEDALYDWRDDLQWMRNLYKDILYLLKEHPTTRKQVFDSTLVGSNKFTTVIDELALLSLLITELEWDPEDFDAGIVKEVLTIHSYLTGEAISEDCFVVTSDFMLIHEVLTGEFPNDGSTSTCQTGDSV